MTGDRRHRVIAAIDDDDAASGVLSVGRAIAALFSASLEAVHVGEPAARLVATAHAAGVPLRTIPGRASEALASAASGEDVAAVVIGAGAVANERLAGSTALALLTALKKPLAVVPANAVPGRGIGSVLVPLDGSAASAAACREIVELAKQAKLRIVVAHVQEEHALPAFSDHLPHEVRAWREEFITRYSPLTSVTLELRVGEPQARLLAILRRSGCDLVALGWSQELAAGRAAVVRGMLSDSPVPVLLTPVALDADVDSTSKAGSAKGRGSLS